MNNEIQRFDFRGASLRTLTDEAGEPWFVAKDVCDILELTNLAVALQSLDDDEKTNLSNSYVWSEPGRRPLIISEPGLYRLVMRSRKPEAKEFQRWVTHEMLPQIRRTGGQKTSCNLIGERFGRLTVISKNGKTKWGNVTWKCACDCGKTVIIPVGHLKSGHTKSCGCLAYDMHVEQLETHGYTTGGKPRTFTIWRGMKARCLNPKSISYKNYGARGISICHEWRSFKAFHEWAIANGYSDGLQLDRIDNDGNYCPNNCRWVTRTENARNTRATHLITLNGKTQCAAAWIEELGISKSTFYEALHKGQTYLIRRYCLQPSLEAGA